MVIGEPSLIWFALEGCRLNQIFEAISDIAYAVTERLKKRTDAAASKLRSRLRAILHYAMQAWENKDITALFIAWGEIHTL